MRSLPSLVATVVLGAGAAGFAPPAAAGHIVIGIGIGLPGIAYAAPVPLLAAAAPNYYYGTAYYGPGFYGLGYVAVPWYGYRYYAPEPGPTPVITATITYKDGRPDESVRIPQRGVLPRLRYQRQLALANHLATDFSNAKRDLGDGGKSHYARSYASHLAQSRTGCASITLFVQAHLIPDPVQIRNTLAAGESVNLDAEEFFTAPERIGEFPCEEL